MVPRWVARPKSSVPEVVVDGATGILADSHQALVDAGLDRAACRRHVETAFSATAMTQQYEDLYGRLLA